MAISTDLLTATQASDRTWRKFTGMNVTVYVPPGNSLDERANQELREAEQLLDSLKKLLEVSEEHPVHIHIYLAGTSTEFGPEASHNGHSDYVDRHSSDSNADAIVYLIDPSKARESLA